MSYPSYLIHFNPNHDPKNGRFASGTKYHNPDGSLTKAGTRRYNQLDKMSDGKLYKTLKKEVRQAKAKNSAWYNQWAWDTPTGQNSKKVLEEKIQKEKEYKKTDAYKKWISKINSLERSYELGKVDDDEYDRRHEKIMSEQPKRNFNTIYGTATSGKYGLVWLNDFAKKGGRDLSLAHMKDLGYDDKKSKEYVDRLAKLNLSLH